MKRIFIIFGIIVSVCVVALGQQSALVPFQLPLSGRLVSGLDPSKLINTLTESAEISNFATLTNMEYTDNGIRSIRGYSTITTNKLADHPKIHNMFQFVKSNPVETHILVQARNSAETESKVFAHSTSTPNTGTFTPTALHTDASGYGTGRFSDAPIGHVVYCNGKETQVWGGNENSPGFFSIFDGTDPSSRTAWLVDYTGAVTNNLTDAQNIATFKQTDVAHYNIGVGSVTAYVNSRLPIDGIKLYVGTANTATGTTQVHYWNGSTLTAVTGLSDGTSSGGIPVAQTGYINFDTTETTAKVRLIEGIYGYWYRLIFPGADATTTISQVTVSEPFQRLSDFWDGELRAVNSVILNKSESGDNTTNVLKDEYSFDNSTKGDIQTYMNLSGFTTAHSYVVGFTQRAAGIRIKFVDIAAGVNHVNDSASVLSVKYWNGFSWVAVNGLVDGSANSATTITHNQDGFITWAPVDENVEFKISLNQGEPLYYYQFTTSANFDASDNYETLVSYIGGIPAQRVINNYKFSLNAQGRLWLFNDQSASKNMSIMSNVATLNVFNGEDSGDALFYGNDEEVQAAIALHSRVQADSTDPVLVLKNNATFIVTGNDPETWNVVTLSDRIGCNAPLTLSASSIGLEFAPLQNKQISIWQGNGGIYVWDGSSIMPISDAISNYFDQGRPEAMPLSKSHLSVGFFETHDSNHYYHWLFSSNSTSTNDLDTEMVFDLRRQGWFKVERSVPIQSGINVIATDTGATYAYGAIDTGDLMRLNNGTDWNGTSITSTFETGDIPMSGNVMTETKLRYLRLGMVTKSTTTNTVTVTHFVDGKNTGESFSLSPSLSGYRITMPVVSRNQYGTFHRFKCTMTANDETRGFEPLFLGGLLQEWREVHQ